MRRTREQKEAREKRRVFCSVDGFMANTHETLLEVRIIQTQIQKKWEKGPKWTQSGWQWHTTKWKSSVSRQQGWRCTLERAGCYDQQSPDGGGQQSWMHLELTQSVYPTSSPCTRRMRYTADNLLEPSQGSGGWYPPRIQSGETRPRLVSQLLMCSVAVAARSGWSRKPENLDSHFCITAYFSLQWHRLHLYLWLLTGQSWSFHLTQTSCLLIV